MFSQIPNFEMLENNTYEASGNKRSLFEDKNVVELLKEIQNDLLSKNDNDDFGLAELFEESQSGAKYSTSGVKSKAAKKRKKQQQKLRRLVVSRKTENNRRNFAQSFQELQNSQVVFDDSDIDSSITCPVCLEMYHMPRTCNPCGHIFCDPCLRRLTGQGSEGIPCPLCRTVIYSCELNKDFEYLSLTHPDIYRARAMLERHTKFRHYQLPYTAPVPLGKRLMRQLVASRNSQSDTRWMSHDWFKFLLGCTAGMCLSLLIMLYNRVKSVRDARDVNIVFLSILIGASVTFLIFKFMKI
ncbi:uncharacterized protein LOC123548932 [Mercenaria mercenaria]|uniref:uncharacterized protein LOC123548932 n=1 Tax=Mercenaria mercenaria TaxID=6596 RepID=UPI00234F3134|nr:uncharacterized protein LOC123548932 [Mercenaria mercenaria]